MLNHEALSDSVLCEGLYKEQLTIIVFDTS